MKRVLTFLNLVDSSGNLSITNVAVIVVITKIALLKSFSLTEASALLITMVNYAHKRFETNKQLSVPEVAPIDLNPVVESIEALKTQINSATEVAVQAKEKVEVLGLAMGLKGK
jgi:hypothetical protein